MEMLLCQTGNVNVNVVFGKEQQQFKHAIARDHAT
jgi:hypothetical protein